MPALEGIDSGGEPFCGIGFGTGDCRLDDTNALLTAFELSFDPLLQIVQDKLSQFDVGLEALDAIGGGGDLVQGPDAAEQAETLADRALAEVEFLLDLGETERHRAGKTDPVDRCH